MAIAAESLQIVRLLADGTLMWREALSAPGTGRSVVLLDLLASDAVGSTEFEVTETGDWIATVAGRRYNILTGVIPDTGRFVFIGVPAVPTVGPPVVIPPEPPIIDLKDYSDDFNRADGDPGSSWTLYTSGAAYLSIVNNELTATAANEEQLGFWNLALPVGQVHHRAEVRIGSAVPSTTYLFVRGSESAGHVRAQIHDTGVAEVLTSEGALIGSVLTPRVDTTGVLVAPGGLLSLEAAATNYIVRVDGAEVLRWPDDTGLWAHVDDAHLNCGAGLNLASLKSRGRRARAGVGMAVDDFAITLVTPAVEVTADFSGTGALAAELRLPNEVLPKFAGEGALSAVVEGLKEHVAKFSGIGRLIARAEPTVAPPTTPDPQFNGEGSLGVSLGFVGVPPTTPDPQFNGEGSLGVTLGFVGVPPDTNDDPQFNGEGTLGVTLGFVTPKPPSTEFTGEGSLSAVAYDVLNPAIPAGLSGEGALTATATSGVTRFTGEGSLTATVYRVYADSFDRADGDPGSDWVLSHASPATTDLQILNNELILTANNTFQHARWATPMRSPDHRVEFTVGTVVPSGFIRLQVRHGADARMNVSFSLDAANGWVASLHSVEGDDATAVFTGRASGWGFGPVVTGTVLSFEAVGSTPDPAYPNHVPTQYIARVDGVTVASWYDGGDQWPHIDDQHLTVGVQLSGTMGDSVDNFRATDLTGATVAYTKFADDFNRPDGPLGADWWYLTYGNFESDLAIVGNEMVVTRSGVGQAGWWKWPMPTDDHRVEITIGSSVPVEVQLLVRGSQTDGLVCLDVNASTGICEIRTQEGPTLTGPATPRYTSPAGTATLVPGAVLAFEAFLKTQTTEQVYNAYVDGVLVASWIDDAAAWDHVDADHRNVAVLLLGIVSDCSVDNFTATDLSHVEHPALPHYADDFNRPDGHPGPDWWVSALSGDVAIIGNELALTADGDVFAWWNTPLPSCDHQVQVTVGSIVPEIVSLSGRIRADGDAWIEYVSAVVYPPLGLCAMGYNTTGAGGWVYTVRDLPIPPVVAGSVLSFECNGLMYALRLDGVVVASWRDSDRVFSPFSDEKHRHVSVEVAGLAGSGIDDFTATDLTVVPVKYATWTDDFNRADGWPGADWLLIPYVDAAHDGPELVILNNELALTHQTAEFEYSWAWRIAPMPGPDHAVQVTVGSVVPGETSLCARGSLNDGRMFLNIQDDGSARIVSVEGDVCHDTTTIRASCPAGTFAVNPGTVIYFKADGPLYNGIVDGVQVVTWTDTADEWPHVDDQHLDTGVCFGGYTGASVNDFTVYDYSQVDGPPLVGNPVYVDGFARADGPPGPNWWLGWPVGAAGAGPLHIDSGNALATYNVQDYEWGFWKWPSPDPHHLVQAQIGSAIPVITALYLRASAADGSVCALFTPYGTRIISNEGNFEVPVATPRAESLVPAIVGDATVHFAASGRTYIASVNAVEVLRWEDIALEWNHIDEKHCNTALAIEQGLGPADMGDRFNWFEVWPTTPPPPGLAGEGTLSATVVAVRPPLMSNFDFHEAGGNVTQSLIGGYTMAPTDPATAWQGEAAVGEFEGVVGNGILGEWTAIFVLTLNSVNATAGPSRLEITYDDVGEYRNTVGFNHAPVTSRIGPDGLSAVVDPRAGGAVYPGLSIGVTPWEWSTTPMVVGVPHMLICTGSAATGTTLYLDGVEILNVPSGGSARHFDVAATLLDSGYAQDAHLDNVTYLAVALTPAQVAAIPFDKVRAPLEGEGTLSAEVEDYAWYHDNFNRADGPPGGSWTLGAGSVDLVISNNELALTGDGNQWATWNRALPGPDHKTEVRVGRGGIPTTASVSVRSSSEESITAQWRSDTGVCWIFSVDPLQADRTILRAESAPAAFVMAEGTLLSLEAIGPHYTARVNGKVVAHWYDIMNEWPFVDATHLQAMVELIGLTGNSVDYFKATDLTGVPFEYPIHGSDDFDRPDGPLGSNWTVKHIWEAVTATVKNGQLWQSGSGTTQYIWAAPLPGDDMSIEFTVGDDPDSGYLIRLRYGDNLWQQVKGNVNMMEPYDDSMYEYLGPSIATQGSANDGGLGRAYSTWDPAIDPGSKILFEAVGQWYVVSVDGRQRASWKDTAGEVPIGADRRHVVIELSGSTDPAYAEATADNVVIRDLSGPVDEALTALE